MNNNEIISLYFSLIEIKHFSSTYDRSINYTIPVMNKLHLKQTCNICREKNDIFIKILIIEYFEKKLLNYSRENNTMHIFLFHISGLLLKLQNAFFFLHQQTHCRFSYFISINLSYPSFSNHL